MKRGIKCSPVMELFSTTRRRLLSAQSSNKFGYGLSWTVSFILQLNKHNSFLPLEPSSPSTKELHGPDHRSHDKINWRGVSLSPFCLKFWHRLHWLTDDDGTKKYAHPMRKKLKNCFSFFYFFLLLFALLLHLLTYLLQHDSFKLGTML